MQTALRTLLFWLASPLIVAVSCVVWLGLCAIDEDLF